MGGGHYSLDIAYENRSGARAAFAQPATETTRMAVHPALNPLGKVREVNNETPIVVALDVTRSRGDDTKLMYDKLPQLMGQLELKGYVKNPGICFAAIGDVDADRAPLQVGQFEADNRLDEVLERFWIEEGGGGTGQESYELAAYFFARTNCVRLAAGTGKKGYFFFVGDEGFYPTVEAARVRKVIGDELTEDLDSAQVFARLQEKFHVFFIFPRKTLAERKSNIDAEIKDRVTRAGGMYDGVDIRASLLWDNRNDLDLHVIAPSTEHIYYGHKVSGCGGWLDVDMNVQGDTVKPVENVRWPKGRAPAGRYKVFVQNFRFHEPSQAPTRFKVELEVAGEIRHVDGIISPNGQTRDASDVVVAEFDYSPDLAAEAERREAIYAAYSDETVLGQWAKVIPRDHILRVGDPKAIIEVLAGALGIANGATDLDGVLADLRERGEPAERVSEIEAALSGLARVRDVAAASVSGEVPSGATGGPKRSVRL
ncbi:MAG: hypothetical protein JNJ59_23875 [Deltaproteobacteria bacterium]|nr:hypothetical protein [Deltaproteobacteria bacterium]